MRYFSELESLAFSCNHAHILGVKLNPECFLKMEVWELSMDSDPEK